MDLNANLDNKEINARVLNGQSWKNRASSELLYKTNRPQVSMVLRHDKPFGMLHEQSKNSFKCL